MKKSEIARWGKMLAVSAFIGLFAAYALTGMYDVFFDNLPEDAREAGGRFELFVLFLFYLWPLCSLAILLINWLAGQFWPGAKYVVLQTILLASILVSGGYIFFA